MSQTLKCNPNQNNLESKSYKHLLCIKIKNKTFLEFINSRFNLNWQLQFNYAEQKFVFTNEKT